MVDIRNMRVVILDPPPWVFFGKNVCGFPGSDDLDTLSFLEVQYIEEVTEQV